MLQKARAFLPALNPIDATQWMGFRPSLPDSRPAIGYSRDTRRVVFAFGHGHLGLTQSAATALIVAELLGERAQPIDISPFSPQRFQKGLGPQFFVCAVLYIIQSLILRGWVMTIEFKGSYFERDVILWGVRWYVTCPISYRQIEEMMGERGIEVGHSTLHRCVVKNMPALEKAFLARSVQWAATCKWMRPT
jgi:hypothetical protein